MDRGRVGYDLVSNRKLREIALNHKRDVHLERLSKIKNRVPGSSSTLDNNPPKTLSCEKFKHNPRKQLKKIEELHAVERQNKVLLQRITGILTAPPSITDEDYLRMQKLMYGLKSTDAFQHKIDEKRKKDFFVRVNKTSAYYHPKQWEQEYQTQLLGQKFMRQVVYKRPAGFVDPFASVAPPKEPATLSPARGRKTEFEPRVSKTRPSTKDPRATSNHVSKMRSVQSSKPCVGADEKGGGGAGGEVDPSKRVQLLGRTDRLVTCVQVTATPQGAAPSSDATSQNNSPIKRSLSLPSLGSSASAPSSTSSPPPASLSAFEVLCTVRCWLVSEAVMGVSVRSVNPFEGEKPNQRVSFKQSTPSTSTEHFPLVAEAHIFAEDLFPVNVTTEAAAGDVDELGTADFKAKSVFPTDDLVLRAVAMDVIEQVNIRIENGENWVVLVRKSAEGLVDDAQEEDDAVVSATKEAEHWEGGDEGEQAAQTELTTEDALSILQDFLPVAYSVTMPVPLDAVVTYPASIEIFKSTAGKVMGKQLTRSHTSLAATSSFPTEMVSCVVEARRIAEEKAEVRVTPLADSTAMSTIGRKVSPAVYANMRIEAATFLLPSVLAIETELIESFLQNVVKSVRIKHSCGHGTNSLVVS